MENKIGALWLKTSKKGSKYMSGVVDIDGVKTNLVIFKNNNKQKENHPDYEIYKSEPRTQENVQKKAVENTFTDDEDILF